jgi:hypothetical protein
MRINTIGTPLVTRPEDSLQVGAAPVATPVRARTSGAGEMLERPAPLPAATGYAPAEPAIIERRQQSRRGEDRRKRQIAVLIDTRVAQRRVTRRRAQDEVPASIDLEA